MAKHKWSLWDGMRCLEVGTVEGGTEKEALKVVAPTVALKPERSYKVRIGADTIASFYPDEFVRVQADQSQHEKDPAARAGGQPYLFSDMVKKLDAKKIADLLDEKTKKSLKELEESVTRLKKAVAGSTHAINTAAGSLKPPIQRAQMDGSFALYLSQLAGQTILEYTAMTIWEILLRRYGGSLRGMYQVAAFSLVRGGYRVSVADVPSPGDLDGITITFEAVSACIGGIAQAKPAPLPGRNHGRLHRILPSELCVGLGINLRHSTWLSRHLEQHVQDLPLVAMEWDKLAGRMRFEFDGSRLGVGRLGVVVTETELLEGTR